MDYLFQWQMQDFSGGGAPTYYFGHFPSKNCMKMKSIIPRAPSLPRGSASVFPCFIQDTVMWNKQLFDIYLQTYI